MGFRLGAMASVFGGGMRALGSAWLAGQRGGLLRLRAAATRQGRYKPKARHLETGERGEFEALFFLRRLGYKVFERRWRTPEWNGDLDLIAWKDDALCFVEVKTRTARDFAPAAAAIDESKRKMLRQMARAYRRTLPRAQAEAWAVRFDVVSVYLLGDVVECELAVDAFGWAEDDFRGSGV